MTYDNIKNHKKPGLYPPFRKKFLEKPQGSGVKLTLPSRFRVKLRTKAKEYKGTATSLSGAGKLTVRTINSMQNYYGKAIRSNSNPTYAMKKPVGSILWHCTEFGDNDCRHR